jgi:biopolymer transport protein ExbB
MQAPNWLSWWNDADFIVRSVFILLVCLSLASWTVMLSKSVKLVKLERAEHRVADILEAGGELTTHLAPALSLGLLGGRPVDRSTLDDHLGRFLSRRRIELESGLTLLATIGNTTPFIGLFGTVWGIMHALQGLSGAKVLSMAVISGPVAEALVATAMGLFVAIPAVAGYNLLLRRLRRLTGLIEDNGHTILIRQAERPAAAPFPVILGGR